MNKRIKCILELGRTSDVLREATVNIIENIDCSSYLTGNITRNAIRRAKVKQTLPNGINAQLICSTGIKNETTGVYTVKWIIKDPYFIIY